MRSRANEPVRIGPVTDHDFIDYVFQPNASWSHHGNKGDLVAEALLNKVVKETLVGHGRV